MSDKKALNAYLALEFGFVEGEEDEAKVTDSWPFSLAELGKVDDGETEWTVYGFTDEGEDFFALDGPSLSFVPTGGLDLDGLRQEWKGGSWLAANGAVDLSVSRPGDPTLPSSLERRERLEALMGATATEGEAATLKVGMYLQRTGDYLGLAEIDKQTWLFFGTAWPSRRSPISPLSPWRALAHFLGSLLWIANPGSQSTDHLEVRELDGTAFDSLDEFFDEVERKILDPGVNWGRNLDAFNDVLRGGFGSPEGGFVLRWKDSEISRQRLLQHTPKWLEAMLSSCHPTNRPSVRSRLDAALDGRGENLFDTLVEIIRTHGPGGEEAEDQVVLELR